MEIEKSIWDQFTQFRQICRNNPVFPKCSFLEHLEEVLPQFVMMVGPEELFYRARIYQNNFPEMALDYAKRIHDDIEHGDQILKDMKIAFDKIKELKQSGFNGFDATGSFVNPSPKDILGGRCNHVHEVCLYVAEDVETAISELKPLIQEEISVACIRTKEELRVIDFGFNISDNPYKELASLLFITSPTQEDYDAYAFTQVICSLVKNKGYDGIRYTSCQNLIKANYVIFNYDKCEAVSSEVYRVDSIKYGFAKK